MPRDSQSIEPTLGGLGNETPPMAMDDLDALELERRQAIEREMKLEGIRSFFKGFFLTIIVVGLCVGAFFGVRYALTLPYFHLTKLVVVGDTTKVSPARLKDELTKVIDGNFFTVDMERIRDAVVKVPWVKNANVRRVWPNELVVTFTTRRAVAVYEDGRLVDDQSELFVGNPEEQEAGEVPLPNFYGTPGQIKQIANYYREFSLAVRPLGVIVTDVYCSDRGSWSLTVTSKDIPPTRIDLGQDKAGSEGVMDKLVNVVAAYPRMREILQGPPSSIDARYNRAFSASPPSEEYLAKPPEDVDEDNDLAQDKDAKDTQKP